MSGCLGWCGKRDDEQFSASDISVFMNAYQHIEPITIIYVRDGADYKLAKKVSDEKYATINPQKILPYESWNYCILPH
jgi:hypothetical protein